jgi:hypothetical protein
MIEGTWTGQIVDTEVLPVDNADIESLEPGWGFDWPSEVVATEVFKLVIAGKPLEILGLMSLSRCPMYIYVPLLESAPGNVGREKRWSGVAGSLLAFAARLSFATGGEGFVSLLAKTDLMEHFREFYGFTRQGRGQTMVLDTTAAARLIATFEKGLADGNSPRTE